jgi:phosphohistidine phosphatase
MRVLLVRHGEAVDPYEADSDGQRWLTARGRSVVRSVGALVADAGVRLDRIFTSPLVRAVQTAEILASATAFDGALEVWPDLAGGTTARALGALERAEPGEIVALVGHEPLIRAMTAHLVGDARFPGYLPGMICVIAASAEGNAFEWAIDPREARRVDRIEDIPR